MARKRYKRRLRGIRQSIFRRWRLIFGTVFLGLAYWIVEQLLGDVFTEFVHNYLPFVRDVFMLFLDWSMEHPAHLSVISFFLSFSL